MQELVSWNYLSSDCSEKHLGKAPSHCWVQAAAEVKAGVQPVGERLLACICCTAHTRFHNPLQSGSEPAIHDWLQSPWINKTCSDPRWERLKLIFQPGLNFIHLWGETSRAPGGGWGGVRGKHTRLSLLSSVFMDLRTQRQRLCLGSKCLCFRSHLPDSMPFILQTARNLNYTSQLTTLVILWETIKFTYSFPPHSFLA